MVTIIQEYSFERCASIVWVVKRVRRSNVPTPRIRGEYKFLAPKRGSEPSRPDAH